MVSSTFSRRLSLARFYPFVIIFLVASVGLFALASVPYSSAAPLADAVEIVKSVDKTTVDSEEIFEYTLQYSCSSIDTLYCTNVVITDVLPAALDETNVTLIGSIHTLSSANDNGTVTFTFVPTMTAGTTGEVKIRAQFPVGPADGTAAVNSAEIGADEGTATSNPVTTTLNYSSPPTLDTITAGKESGNGNSFQVNETVSYALYARNDGDNGLDNFYYEDFLPSGIEFVSFESGAWTANVPMTITYQTNVTPTWTTWPASFTWNSDDAHNVSELGLGSGEYVTALRWDFGDVPANFSHDGNRPRINATVLATNNPGDTIQNCNVATGGGFAGIISDTTCYDITVEAPPPTVTDTVSASKLGGSGSSLAVGQETNYIIYTANESEHSVDNFYFEDFLPATVELTRFESGGWSDNVPMTITYQTSVTPTWTTWPAAIVWNSDDMLYVSDLGLNSGETVTAIRWDFGTVPAGFTHDGNRPRVYATLLPSNNEGDVITNCNTTGAIGISGVISDTACYNITVAPTKAFPWVGKTTESGNLFERGEVFTMTMRVGSSQWSSMNLTNTTIMDLLPNGLSYAGSWEMSNDSYPTPTFTESADHDGTGRTLLRWAWNNLTLTPSDYFDIYVGVIGTELGTITNEYEVTADTPFDDCYREDGFRADQYDMDGDGDRAEEFCWENTSVTIRPDGPMPQASKTLVTSGAFLPGQTVTWEIRAENLVTGTANYDNPIVMDLLPSELEFTGSWTIISNTGDIVPTPIFEQLTNHNGTGRTLLRWSWTGASAYAVDNGEYLAIQFATQIKDGTGGSITNDYNLTSNDSPTDDCSGAGLRADTNDMDGDANTAEQHCYAEASLTVESVAALESEKLVLGQLDTEYSKFPVVGATIPGGTDDYKLTISNPGNVTMTNVIIYDILPYVGDTGVKVTEAPRLSQWRPNLVGSVAAPAGVVVYYSTSTNPCRPEIIAAGPVGCVDDWSIILPDDPTTVAAIKIEFGTLMLSPADSFTLSWPMRAPIDAPTGGEVAWNSFAYVADRADNGDTLLPAEPIKVGVATFPQDPAVYGDFVWIDTDRDGVQDGGELGIDGVRVDLYRDNGDGISNPATDTFESFTLTTDGGQYVFPNLEPGDYYAVVYIPPTYSMSLPEQDENEAIDSDGSAALYKDHAVAIMPVTTLDATEIDLSWDQGIFQPPLPKAAVGNYVWFDEDGDGTQNESAANGLNGMTVSLYSTSNPTTPTLTTVTRNDVNGNPGYFLFDQLEPDDYFIEFSLPGGGAFSPQGSTGSSDPIDSDANASGITEVFTLSGGEYDKTWEAGIILSTGSLTIGDRVWHDVNNDGDYDPFDGETGFDNVVVNLYIDTDGSGDFTPGVDEFRATATTFTRSGEPGYYEFTNLPAGDYIVQIAPENFDPSEPLENLSSSTGNGVAPDPDNDTDDDDNGEPITDYGVVSQALTISDTIEPTSEDGDNNTNMTVDFGFYDARVMTGAIGNYVWIDEDSDGFQDAGERGIPNAIVTLTDGSGNVFTTTTDANGGYLFSGLAADSYTVRVDVSQSALSGMSHTGVNLAGADFGNQNPAGYAILLGEGEENLSADFGFNYGDANGNTGVGAIGDRIWLDVDGDGAQDSSEIGISGVTVQLVDPTTGAVISTTTTDATGLYIFDGLPAGAYDVIIPASNFTSGQPLENFTQTGDPDHYGTTGTNDNQTTSSIVLAPGDTFLNVDFGYQPPASTYDNSIGDTVWFDADGDGTINGSEYGIANVTVSLFDNSGNVIATTTTDENGNYLFPNLPDGTYSVEVTDTNNVLAGLTQSGDPDAANGDAVVLDNRSTVSVSGGTNNTVQDFGYTPDTPSSDTGLIGDTIWLNIDGDATQDADEPGLEGVVVTLATPAGGVITTTTDENGHYYFAGLDPNGTYTVTISPINFAAGGVLENLDNTADPNGGDDNTSTVTLTPGSPTNLDQDFGYTPASGQEARIGNLVWLDTDADGVMDAGEQPIGNVTIDLYRDLNGNGQLDAGEPLFGSTVTTDTVDAGTYGADGTYIFEGLPAGDYIVDVTDHNNVLDGYWHSLGTAGVDNNSQVDAYAVSVAAGSDALSADFGYYVEPAAIGNYIWHDVDHNGIQDDAAPLSGITVTLAISYPNGTTITLTTVTDVDGFYSFDNLLTDEDYNGDGSGSEPTYTITAEAPDGYSATDVSASGSTSANDSNDTTGTAAQPVQGQLDVSAGVTTTIASYDFGFWQPLAIGNFLWDDTEGAVANNGIYESGTESGIDGVTLQLYLDDGDGVFNILSDTLQTQLVTDNGFYLFDNLEPEDYFIHVPNTEFQSGGGLYDADSGKPYSSVTNGTAPADDGNDHDSGENGVDSATPEVTGITTNLISLGRSSEPTSELQSAPDGYMDSNANLTVDLAFFLLSPTAVQMSAASTTTANAPMLALYIGVLGLGLITASLLQRRRQVAVPISATK